MAQNEEMIQRARSLRADAKTRLERVEALRRQAEAEEQHAWGELAQAAVLEARAAARNTPARRRQAISGDPKSSGNRVLALMQALCIDERINFRDGLDGPLRMVEGRLGICYARRGVPTVGMRIGHCEQALDHPEQIAA